MPGSGYGSPEFRRWQQRPHWAYYVSKYGDSVAAGGIKAYQASKYAALAHSGYKLGRKLLDSFSQKEQTNMPPVKRRLSYSSSSSKSMKTTPRRQAQYKSRKAKLGAVTAKRQLVTYGRLSGKVKSRNRRMPIKAMYENKGISLNTEYSQTLDSSGNPTVIVGHGTFATEQVMYTAMASIVKRLFAKMNLPVTSWDDVLRGADFTIGDTFQFVGRRQQAEDPSTCTSTLIAAHIGAVGGFRSLVVRLTDLLRAWVNGNSVSPGYVGNQGVVIAALTYTPATSAKKPRTEIQLTGAKIDLYIKSDLKMQNQSLTVAADNQADNVNNVPIYGKSYSGTGSGIQIMCPRSVTPGADTRQYNIHFKRGIIAETSNASNLLNEPWQRKQIRFAKQDGKLGINPGEIKTSGLVSKFSVRFDYLAYVCFQQFDPALAGIAVPNPRSNLGKFRVMILDKVIGLAGATGVKIAYEHNYYCAAIFKPSYSNMTVPLYEFLA